MITPRKQTESTTSILKPLIEKEGRGGLRKREITKALVLLWFIERSFSMIQFDIA